MTKIGLEYPLDASNSPKGTIYEFEPLNLIQTMKERKSNNLKTATSSKSWWKFW